MCNISWSIENGILFYYCIISYNITSYRIVIILVVIKSHGADAMFCWGPSKVGCNTFALSKDTDKDHNSSEIGED